MNKICLLTVFYNTPNLFKPLYGSYMKTSGLSNVCDFYIFENSSIKDKQLRVHDINVNIEYIPTDFYKELPQSACSAKHTMTINYALNKLKSKYDFCILCDSDVIFVKDVMPIIEQMKRDDITLAGYHDITSNRNLIHPCAMIIDLKKIQNINFFDKKRMYGINGKKTYDTGMSFYEDVVKAGLKVLELPYNYFAHHFGGGSRNYATCGKVENGKIYRNLQEWLNDFKDFT